MCKLCKLYKHNKQNKHNANLTMSPPLEPHAPQLENQAPWQEAVVLVVYFRSRVQHEFILEVGCSTSLY